MIDRHRVARAAAQAFLRAVNTQVESTLKRIDVIDAKIQEQKRTSVELRARAREQTKAWFEEHPDEAEAISALFGFHPNSQ